MNVFNFSWLFLWILFIQLIMQEAKTLDTPIFTRLWLTVRCIKSCIFLSVVNPHFPCSTPSIEKIIIILRGNKELIVIVVGR